MSGGRAATGSFLALQQLARSFGEPRTARRERELHALALDLGPVAVPLLLREVGGADVDRRAWAADLLRTLAGDDGVRPRVVADLHALAADDAPADDAKVAALAVLADLGEPVAATFRDPGEVHRRSLADLADLLTCRPDVALAADLLVQQLEGDALLDFVDGLAQTAPRRTRHLVDELLVRTDLDPALRAELLRVAAPLALVDPEPLAAPPRRPSQVTILRNAGGRTILIVTRQRRCLCLLVDDDGLLAEAMYRDEASPRAIEEELVAPLVADGYEVLRRSPDGSRTRAPIADARALLLDAARATVAAGAALPSAYFLGRDLLDLADEHQAPGGYAPDLPTTLLGRAIDLVAAGEPERARPLLERCVELAPADADAASSYGLVLLAAGELDGARAQLERAARLEPAWPLHHWNLAALALRAGALDACDAALRRFLDTAPRLPGAADDPDHQARVALAERFVAERARWVRLEAKPPRARRPRKLPASPRKTRRPAR